MQFDVCKCSETTDFRVGFVCLAQCFWKTSYFKKLDAIISNKKSSYNIWCLLKNWNVCKHRLTFLPKWHQLVRPSGDSPQSPPLPVVSHMVFFVHLSLLSGHCRHPNLQPLIGWISKLFNLEKNIVSNPLILQTGKPRLSHGRRLSWTRSPSLDFFPAPNLLRYNWHITLRMLKVHNVLIWYTSVSIGSPP